jgi:hypothetical protein
MLHTITWSEGKGKNVTQIRLVDGGCEFVSQNLVNPSPNKPVQSRHCCRGAPIQKWLLIRWYGIPKPKRWLMKKPLSESDLRGCGCPVKCRTAWEAIRMVWNA